MVAAVVVVVVGVGGVGVGGGGRLTPPFLARVWCVVRGMRHGRRGRRSCCYGAESCGQREDERRTDTTGLSRAQPLKRATHRRPQRRRQWFRSYLRRLDTY